MHFGRPTPNTSNDVCAWKVVHVGDAEDECRTPQGRILARAIGYKADGPGPFVFRSFFEIFAVAISGSVWTRSGVRYYCQLQ